MSKLILKSLFVIALFCFSFSIFAQDTRTEVADVISKTTKASEALKAVNTDSLKHWKISGSIGLNTSATVLWNWAAGGSNSASAILFGNARLIYKKNRFVWESTLDTDFGYTYLDKTKFPLRKSNDKIIINTKAGYDLGKKFYMTILGGFRSQYSKGYDYPAVNNEINEVYISNWLSPSYTDISAGIDWKPNNIFSVYLSPVAGRVTTSTDTTASLRKIYGVDMIKGYKAEFGASLRASANYTYKTFKVVSVMTLFSPYTHFGNVDVDWDLAVSYQFLKVLNVSLGTTLKYYDAVKFDNGNGVIRQHVQFKTVVGVGIGYTF
ncbi:MAG: DUF3078 domain-containing protein [Prevotellaceae bacterium]|jgi:hypothetical protein|nr:DUF3078 domain-containing protein [Prevotellaceae bacterium]